MKRKLNGEQVPTPVEPTNFPHQESKFASLGLDSRLLQAIAQENFSAPTMVQSEAIPLILDSKDVLGQTGTLKTDRNLIIMQLEQRLVLEKQPPTFFQCWTLFCVEKLCVETGCMEDRMLRKSTGPQTSKTDNSPCSSPNPRTCPTSD